jgi:hypothetical protein
LLPLLLERVGVRGIKSTSYTPSSQPGTLASLSLKGEGAGTCVDTYARRERGTKAAILARSTNLLLFVLRRKLHAFKINGLVSWLASRQPFTIKVTLHFTRNFLERFFMFTGLLLGLILYAIYTLRGQVFGLLLL